MKEFGPWALGGSWVPSKMEDISRFQVPEGWLHGLVSLQIREPTWPGSRLPLFKQANITLKLWIFYNQKAYTCCQPSDLPKEELPSLKEQLLSQLASSIRNLKSLTHKNIRSVSCTTNSCRVLKLPRLMMASKHLSVISVLQTLGKFSTKKAAEKSQYAAKLNFRRKLNGSFWFSIKGGNR